MTGITLRPVDPDGSPDDGAFLFALFCESRAGAFAVLGLGEAQVTPLLRMQYEAQWRDWRARYPGARFDLVLEGDVAVGRLYVDRSPEAIVLIEISLLAARRGAGLGTALIGAILDEARASDRPVLLHVDHGNPARRLLTGK